MIVVVDSSALIAVLFDEPDRQIFQGIIDNEEHCYLSSVNAHETACVLRGRQGKVAVTRFWQWLTDNEIEIVAFDHAQVRLAAAAFDRYGKGIDSKARLNLADCAAYALAMTLSCPLLFKGGDFSETDVQGAREMPPGTVP